MYPRCLTLFSVGLVALVFAGPAHAQIFARPEGDARAGYAQDVAPWARPSDTGRVRS